jgi:catechol 2,3-dioxygenase-like lactoylglutathione lyase family enzyme
MSVPGPLSDAHAVTKLPAQDLDRARRFYHDKFGLEPVEERDGGLRFICAGTEFHVFSSSGAASGASTQIGFEVTDLKAVIEECVVAGSRSKPWTSPASRRKARWWSCRTTTRVKDPESSAPSPFSSA